MLPRQELSKDIKDAIVGQHQKGKTYTQLAHMFQVSCSTAHSAISKWKSTRHTINMPRVGCPQKLSARAKVKLSRAATVNSMATQQWLLESQGKVALNISLNSVTRAIQSSGLHSSHLEGSPEDQMTPLPMSQVRPQPPGGL